MKELIQHIEEELKDIRSRITDDGDNNPKLHGIIIGLVSVQDKIKDILYKQAAE